ncbi:MAG: SDR family NAD(P)-dependent oxidoreductase, partial [Frankia sp.]
VEQLARIKTVRGIVEWIGARSTPTPSPLHEPELPALTGAARPDGDGLPTIPLRRFVVENIPLPAPPPLADLLAAAGRGGDKPLDGTRFAVIDGGLGIGLELAALLEQHGAAVHTTSADAQAVAGHLATGAGADGIVYLAAIDRGAAAALPVSFPLLKAAALAGSRRLLVATGTGGAFGRPSGEVAGPGVGLGGLVRTLAQEVPGLAVRLVDVDPKDAPDQLAGQLLTELLGSAGPFALGAPTVVGYRRGARSTPRVIERAAGAEAGDLTARLGPDSVVLLTGGARGITARVALSLAARTGCAVELVGRTPLPTGTPDAGIAGATDAHALRRVLIAAGLRKPAEIEAKIGRILAEREITATMAALAATSAGVRYHAVDVRDGGALGAVVADIYRRHGRLDGVVHGAGILEDKLLADKTPESFARVFATKVDGAHALVEALRPDLGFLVLFGSVSGVYGNRGQVDYAAANDALDALAREWSGRFAGRVVAVDWGPWAADGPAGGGMVSAELEREYARRGIALIRPDEGVAALLGEIAGPARDSQVVYMCASAEAFGG